MAGGGTNEDGDVGFQIAPMVDVVFVLLLFFMASAGSQVIPKELSINLPSGQSSSSGVPTTPFIIDISAEGAVSSSGQTFDTPNNKELPALREKLKSNIDKFGDKDPIVIRPDPQTKQDRIIDVLNSAAAAGVKNLTFS